jgi:tight adherence protein B
VAGGEITIIIPVIVALAMAALGYALLGRKIDIHDRTVRRVSSVSGGQRAKRKVAVADSTVARRKQVADTLKELEAKQAQARPKLSLRARLQGAGLSFTPKQFYIGSVVFGVIVAVSIVLFGYGYIAGLLLGFAAGFGLPRWVVSFLTKRRQNAFILEFSNALDIIVRGVKSGLPVNECLKIIANESPAPVGPEFAEVVDGQRMGVPLDQALQKLFERMPVAEVNFFMIVLTIQQKTGGNLAETLGNLARVLRERKKMRAKIQAMSSEAKASAMIIGCLPIAVALILHFTQPNYLTPLFTERLGNIMLIGAAFWMLTGIFIMRKMIKFDF